MSNEHFFVFLFYLLLAAAALALSYARSDLSCEVNLFLSIVYCKGTRIGFAGLGCLNSALSSTGMAAARRRAQIVWH